MSVGGTLVNVTTFDAIAFVARFTFALEAAKRVDTIGVCVAVVLLRFAFVHILAGESISLEVLKVGQSRPALAGKRANEVRAFGIGVARDRSLRAFVNILAADTIAAIANVAFAAERGFVVNATRVSVAIIEHQGALVNIHAACTVAAVAFHASTAKTAVKVVAVCILVTVVGSLGTFVGIRTNVSVAKKSCQADAAVATHHVGTFGIGVTRVHVLEAFVNVRTLNSVALESKCAGARKSTLKVATNRIFRAVIRHCRTFVYVNANAAAVEFVAIVALTFKRTRNVQAKGVLTAIVVSQSAFVHI